MNILIEDNATTEYLTALGDWTKKPVGGKVFPATITAFRVAKQLAIHRFNIVGHISETNQFVNLSHGSGKGLLTKTDGLPGVPGEVPVAVADDSAD